MQKRPIKILSLSHAITDLNQGALPAMLPFFIIAFDLSYTAAAGIVFAVNMSSSIVQPIFGCMADRSSKPWILPISVLLAGIGLGLSGIANSYSLILLCSIISGIGIAAFHPVAARLINRAAGTRKSTAMSFFGVGGTVGFALGPILMGFTLQAFGISGTLVLIVPVVLAAALLYTFLPELTKLSEDDAQSMHNHISQKDNWSAFITIGGIVSLRSIFFFGLNVFIPIYWIAVLGVSEVKAAMALSFFALTGIVGNIVGGRMADKYGRKKVMIYSMSLLCLLLPFFLTIQNPYLATLIVGVIGIIFFTGYSPTITLGQAYLPNRVGLSSGVTLGLAVAVGGGAAPFIGKVADIYGVAMSMKLIAAMPILPLLLTLFLPNIDKKSQR